MKQKTSKIPTAEEFDALKKECNLLRLNLKNNKKKVESLRNSYEKAMAHFKVDSKDQTESNVTVTLVEYAKSRKMCPFQLRNKLKAADILFVDRHVSYLKHPEQFKHMVTYRSYHLRDCFTMQVICWNAAGIEFLNDFVKANYKRQPRKEFSF